MSYQWIKVSWNKNYAPHFIPCCAHLENKNMLLMLGVPPYVTDEYIREVFAKYGTIHDVMSQKKPSAMPKFHIPNTSKYFRNIKSDCAFRCVYVQFIEEEQPLKSFLDAAKVVSFN